MESNSEKLRRRGGLMLHAVLGSGATLKHVLDSVDTSADVEIDGTSSLLNLCSGLEIDCVGAMPVVI
jgi:hypothetical protein